jgi:hypothetical protein
MMAPMMMPPQAMSAAYQSNYPPAESSFGNMSGYNHNKYNNSNSSEVGLYGSLQSPQNPYPSAVGSSVNGSEVGPYGSLQSPQNPYPSAVGSSVNGSEVGPYGSLQSPQNPYPSAVGSSVNGGAGYIDYSKGYNSEKTLPHIHTLPNQNSAMDTMNNNNNSSGINAQYANYPPTPEFPSVSKHSSIGSKDAIINNNNDKYNMYNGKVGGVSGTDAKDAFYGGYPEDDDEKKSGIWSVLYAYLCCCIPTGKKARIICLSITGFICVILGILGYFFFPRLVLICCV